MRRKHQSDALTIIICKGCSAPFIRPHKKGPRPRWCPDCAPERERWLRIQCHYRNGTVRHPDERRCETCNVQLELPEYHPASRFCVHCLAGRRSRRSMAWARANPKRKRAADRRYFERKRKAKPRTGRVTRETHGDRFLPFVVPDYLKSKQ